MSERFENYEVLRRDDGSLFELGRGGMGVTYKAFDTDLHCQVALKVIHPNLLATPGTHERFVREARSAARLRHPNIATVFRLGKTADDSLFYAMEFCEGPTLSQAVHQRGPLPAGEALHIAWQVCKALVLAEQHQLLHRDLKPANLILSERSDEGLVVKVIDFGLAKCVDENQQSQISLATGGFVGTAHFASPEQLEGNDLDIRSDLYSLGGCLWYMLTGAPMYHGSLARVMSQTLNNEPPWERLEHQPEQVVAICRWLLAKERENRPASAAVARQEMERVLHLLNASISYPEEEAPTSAGGVPAVSPYTFRSSVPPPPPSSGPRSKSSLAGATSAYAPPSAPSPVPVMPASVPGAGGAPMPVRMAPASEFNPYRPPTSVPPALIPSSSVPPGSVPPNVPASSFAGAGVPPPGSTSYGGPLSSAGAYGVPLSPGPRVEPPAGPRWGLWIAVFAIVGVLGLAAVAGIGWYVYREMQKQGQLSPVGDLTPTPTPSPTPTPVPTPMPTPKATPFPTPKPTPWPTPPRVVPSPTPISRPYVLMTPQPPPATPYYQPPRATPRVFTFDSPAPWPGERSFETRMRNLSYAEVRMWGDDRLRYAINEIYARHGAPFNDQRIAANFKGIAPWYKPRIGVSPSQIEGEFTPIERANMKVLTDVRDGKVPASFPKKKR